MHESPPNVVSRSLRLTAAAALAALPSFAQAGNDILVYTGNNGYPYVQNYNTYGLDELVGECNDVHETFLFPADLSPYRLVILMAPSSAFTTDQVAQFADFTASGGVLVITKDAAWGNLNVANTLASNLGVASYFENPTMIGDYDSGCGHVALPATAHALNTGAPSLGYGWTADAVPAGPGIEVFTGESGQGLVVVEGNVILASDMDIFMNGCDDFLELNQPFLDNLYGYATNRVCDEDGDGIDREECGGGDCMDCNASVPGTDVQYADLDGDGYGDPTAPANVCGVAGYVANADDCDDADSTVNPDADEVCDGVDNDCANGIDDGVGDIWYEDADEDGFGDPNTSLQACAQPSGYVADATDCDGTTAAVFPGNPEFCDGLDNDCANGIDDGVGDLWYEDADEDSFGDSAVSVQACDQPVGYVADATDCDGTTAAVFPGNPEVCDGLDNDCANGIDDGVGDLWYEDADEDAYGDAAAVVQACEQPVGYVADATDCDGTTAAVFPGNPEVCDGLDNDCANGIDDGVGDLWYEDADADAYGDAAAVVQACEQPVGYVADATDCDGTTAAVFPGNPEFCDGLDNDCANGIDDGVGDLWYEDADEDGFGDSAVSVQACDQPVGYVADATDCDGTTAAVFPGNPEVCDGLDNDCANGIDDGVGDLWYEDADEDAYGDATVSVQACDQPVGYVADATDCDPQSGATYPGAPELCDGLDNDCDLSVPADELDADLDGFATCAGDCDDATPARFPGNAEICDGLDNDCDDVLPADELDADSDGYRVCENDCDDTAEAVNPGATEVCNGGIDDDCDPLTLEGADSDADGFTTCDDCDDADSTAFPGAPELCDGIDNDCDGVVPTDELDADLDGVSTCDGDCDDADSARFPGNTEICDGLDNDCDGIVEDDEADADGDQFLVCENDCDDEDPQVNPDAEELCNGGIDDDCDPETVEPDDLDGDGVCADVDCDDSDPDVYPDAPELCDGVDNGCTGTLPDEDLDQDGDGISICEGDCDDADPTRYPGATEAVNGIDDDCDGELLADERDDDGDGALAADDCDDSDPLVNAAADEICGDGIDNDCVGGDEACPPEDTGEVIDEKGGCSCASGSRGVSGLFLAALGLVGLRRR